MVAVAEPQMTPNRWGRCLSLGVALAAQVLISCGGSSNGSNGALTVADDQSAEIEDAGSETAYGEFPFALWGPWNDGTEPPPVNTKFELAGVVEFDGPCAYLVTDLATYDSYAKRSLFGSEPEQHVRILLAFPDDSPLGPTRWNPADETVSYQRGEELSDGDHITWGDWYYSRYFDVDRQLPIRWGQAGKRFIQKPHESCEVKYLLGL